jgi:MFS family permease
MFDGLQAVKGRVLYRIMSLCCAMAFMMYGYDAGVLGGIQTTKPFLDAIGNPTGTYVIPMIASSYTLAAAVCSLAVMAIGMPLGRRNCILMGDAFVIVGTILQATSFSVAQIIIARVLCGFGIGFISCSVPTYMAEMSIESKERGPEVSIQCIYLITGVAIAYWLDFGVSHSTMELWRFPIAFQGFFAIISGGGMLFLPDTPRWYFAKGRIDEGDDVLRRLWDRPLDDPRVQAMKSEIMASIQLEDQEDNKFNFLDLIWDRSDLRAGRRIRVSFLILSIQQMMGKSSYFSNKKN